MLKPNIVPQGMHTHFFFNPYTEGKLGTPLLSKPLTFLWVNGSEAIVPALANALAPPTATQELVQLDIIIRSHLLKETLSHNQQTLCVTASVTLIEFQA